MSRYNELDLGELGTLSPDWHDQLAHQPPDPHALALAGEAAPRDEALVPVHPHVRPERGLERGALALFEPA